MKNCLSILFLGFVLSAGAQTSPIFTPEEVKAYVPKGPSQRYRYFCSAAQFKYEMPVDSFFVRADSRQYAGFHEKLNADGALVLCVPHEGYCIYPSKIGPVFPALKDRDLLGEIITELHRRDISAFAYVTLGWNLHYSAKHPEYLDGTFYEDVLCFCSPYLDTIIGYSREILRNYPVDGMRWDILIQNARCRCDGCKKLYRETFGEEIPEDWESVGEKRRVLFVRAKYTYAIKRLYDACKAVKPSVEIWHNQLNIDHDAPLSALKYVDLAYVEFGDLAGLLIHNSATPKKGFIVGKIESLPPVKMRMALALGGHAYTYIMAETQTFLPPATEEAAERWRQERGITDETSRANARSQGETIEKLAPFYEMISETQSYYEKGQPVYPDIGVVFCENTRYKFPDFSIVPYTKLLKELGDAYLKESTALEYLASHMLPERELSGYKVLVLPETSGLEPGELDALQAYANGGGNLLIAGDAIHYDQLGEPMKDFALSDEMGLQFSAGAGSSDHTDRWSWAGQKSNGERASIEIPEAGEYTFNLWSSKPNHSIDRIVLFRTADIVPTPELLGTPAGNPEIVSLEAEAFSDNISRDGGKWTVSLESPKEKDFSGTGYIGISDTKDFSKIEGYETQSPELQYQAVFPKAGKWYVWIHQQSAQPAGVFVGVNGKGQTSVDFGNPLSLTNDGITAINITKASPVQSSSAKNIKDAVSTVSTSGKTLIELSRGKISFPLLHVNKAGKGRIYYLASSESVQLIKETIDAIDNMRPVTPEPADKQVVLTRQENQQRWILHLIDDGDYTVDVNRHFVSATKISEQYPAEGWNATLVKTKTGVHIKVSGKATNRLLVLQ